MVIILYEFTLSKCDECGVSSDMHSDIMQNTKKIDLDRYLTLHKVNIKYVKLRTKV